MAYKSNSIKEKIDDNRASFIKVVEGNLKARKMTHIELADRMQISARQLARKINGESKVSLAEAVAIGNILGFSVGFIEEEPSCEMRRKRS